MNEQTNTLIAKWYLAQKNYGSVTARDFSDWAISCLENSLDSKNICILASMFDCNVITEVEDYFYKSLKDLDWEFPDRDKCIKRYAKTIAEKIIREEIKPIDGCKIIKDIYYAFDYADEFSGWHSLYWHGEDLTQEEYNKAIIEEANTFLRDGEIIFPKSLGAKPLFSDIETDEDYFTKLRKKFFGFSLLL